MSTAPAYPVRHPLGLFLPHRVERRVSLTVDQRERLARYGRLGLAKVLEPARWLAADGFPVGRRAASVWSGGGEGVRPGAPWPRTVAAGQRVSNPALAATLDAIATGGRDAHYEGGFAKELVEAVAADGGVMTMEDLARHRGEWVEPITGPIGDRIWDDGFDRVDTPAQFVVSGPGQTIQVEFGAGYPVAQIYAPPGEQYICIEPMTARTNALARSELTWVQPGERWSAVFRIVSTIG